MKYCAILVWLSLFSTCLCQELGNNARAQVSSKCGLVSASGFNYSYALRNEPSSSQRICRFLVECDVKGSTLRKPNDTWYAVYRSIPSFVKPIVAWGFRTDQGSFVAPGGSVSGFEFTSLGSPGIVKAYTEGFVPIPKLVDGEYRPVLPYRDTLFKTYTIGPVGQPTMTLAETVDYMVVQKHQAAAQGWITKQGIVISLDQKLDQAKAKILQGNNKAAANIMNAFVNELQAQKGKAVNEEAYTLLYVNAQWLISRLSPTN